MRILQQAAFARPEFSLGEPQQFAGRIVHARGSCTRVGASIRMSRWPSCAAVALRSSSDAEVLSGAVAGLGHRSSAAWCQCRTGRRDSPRVPVDLSYCMYQAPLTDLRFVLNELLRVPQLAELPRYAEFSAELSDSVLDEAARFGEQVLAPINVLGDTRGAQYRDGGVQMPEEFRDAYAKFIAAGWPQLSAPADRGGQGAPLVLAVACEEIWFGSNLAFMLCPQLSRGGVDALEAVATPRCKACCCPSWSAANGPAP